MLDVRREMKAELRFCGLHLHVSATIRSNNKYIYRTDRDYNHQNTFIVAFQGKHRYHHQHYDKAKYIVLICHMPMC